MAEELEVIIPCYNHETYLDACLDSVRKSNKNVKVTVVISGEKTLPKFVRNYDNVRFLRFKRRLFPSEARNVGLFKSRANWVIFFDSDCIIKKDFLPVLRSLLNKGLDRKEVAITGKISGIKDSVWAEYESEVEAAKGYDHKIKNRTYSKILRGGNFVLNRKFLKKIGGFDTSLPSSEDRELGARISSLGKKILLEDRLVVYHNYSRSLLKILKRHIWHAKGNAILYVKYPEIFKKSFIDRLKFMFRIDHSKSLRRVVTKFFYYFCVGGSYLIFFYLFYLKEKVKKVIPLE